MKKNLVILLVISVAIISCNKENNNTNPEWTLFKYEDGFIKENLFCLYSDNNGKVYVGQEGGMTVIENGKLTNIVNEDLRVVDIYIDEQDRIWAADDLSLLRIFENQEWIIPNDDLDYISQIIKSHDNTFWFAPNSYSELVKYDGSEVKRIHIPDSIDPSGGTRVWCIEEDHNGVIWVGTSYALYSYDGTDWKIYDFLPDEYSERIDCVFEDNLGRLWVGVHYKNVMRFDGSNWEIIEELPSTHLADMCQSTNGDLWFGFKYGGDLWRYDGTNYIPYEEDFIIGRYITDICQSSDGSMWFIGPSKNPNGEGLARLTNWE